MRDINFRGFVKDIGWVYGYLIKDGDTICIVTDGRDNGDHVYVKRGFNVIPESVGQYTGLKDRYSEGIYEGDMVECLTDGLCEVKFRDGCFWLYNGRIFIPFHDIHGECEVKGNNYEKVMED